MKEELNGIQVDILSRQYLGLDREVGLKNSGVVIGPTTKGPVNSATCIHSFLEYEKIFGEDTDKNETMFYAKKFFSGNSKDRRLWVTRVARGAKYGGLTVCHENNRLTLRPWEKGLSAEEIINFKFEPNDLFIVHGLNEGKWNNSTGVSVEFRGQSVIISASNYSMSMDKISNSKILHLSISRDWPLLSSSISFGKEPNIDLIYLKSNLKAKVFVDNEWIWSHGAVSAYLDGGEDGTKPIIKNYLEQWNWYHFRELDTFTTIGNKSDRIRKMMVEVANSCVDWYNESKIQYRLL